MTIRRHLDRRLAGRALSRTAIVLAAAAVAFAPAPAASSPARASAASTQDATGCAVTYTVNAQWRGGFQAALTIRNSGRATIVGWIARFAFPDGQQLTRGFNVGSAAQDGAAVALTNNPYNGTVAPGNSVLLGIQGTWTVTNAPPTAFTVNDTLCTAG
jgi:hypothetical protein